MIGPPRGGRAAERGAMLLAVMVALAITMILSAVAVREWGQVLRRDNEAEMMFRAQDLVRGLRRFQRDKGRLPNELKELLEPGTKGQYFVRQLWKDPLVKGGNWQLLYAGPQGGLFDPSTMQGDGTGTGAAAPPEQPGGLMQTGSIGGTGGGTIPGPPGEISGLPIAGVKSKCTDDPFRVYKQKTEYSEWIFSVFDLDAPQPGTPGAPGAPSPGQPGGRPPAGDSGSPGMQLTPPPGRGGSR